MMHTAVEKAWLKGSFGVITKKEEGIDLAFDSTIVYITRTGIRYHLGSCRHLHSSKIPIEINEAKEEGYTPCKVCKPPN
jgi:methylphosphotriester-DNA--protein-cysteine methyltransferase